MPTEKLTRIEKEKYFETRVMPPKKATVVKRKVRSASTKRDASPSKSPSPSPSPKKTPGRSPSPKKTPRARSPSPKKTPKARSASRGRKSTKEPKEAVEKTPSKTPAKTPAKTPRKTPGRSTSRKPAKVEKSSESTPATIKKNQGILPSLTNSQHDQKLDKEIVYEFGGPVGVTFMVIFFPFLMYYFWSCIEYHDGQLYYPTSIKEIPGFFAQVWDHIQDGALPTWFATKLYVGFCIFQAILGMVMPGPLVKGLPVPSLNFNRLEYLCNGVSSFYTVCITSFALHHYDILPLDSIIDEFGPIMTVAILTGFFMSFAVYVTSLLQGTQHRMSGNHFYDFFMGAPLNPRILNLDLKMWAEIRIPWVVLFFVSVSAAVKSYQEQGVVPPTVAFMVLAHFLYVNACMKGEECIPTTWDIFYEKDGFMLIFWNMAGVPFTYCYSTLYLIKTSTGRSLDHGSLYLWGLFVALLAAYYVWDTANSQKNRFRMMQAGTYFPRWTFPQLPWGTLTSPTYIRTKSGSLLLTSGWWGYARKIHYSADLVMALSWGLICGFDSLIPYFYVVFFIFVLTHRTSRDMERCSKKYGDDWVAYCKKVPWIFIPGIY